MRNRPNRDPFFFSKVQLSRVPLLTFLELDASVLVFPD